MIGIDRLADEMSTSRAALSKNSSHQPPP
jgi:hypothetical protein